MKKNMILGTVCALMVVSGGAAAFADTRGSGQRGIDFSQMDTDGDGQVTVGELEALQAARFAEIDADGDGSVSEAEMLAHAQARQDERQARRVGRMLKRMDANDDGSLSPEELQGRRDPARLIERLDADGNGTLSQQELADARHGMRGGRGERKGRHSE